MGVLENARENIKKADEKLIPLLSIFTPAALSIFNPENPLQKRSDGFLDAAHLYLKERGAPEHLIDLVADRLDWDSLPERNHHIILINLAETLANRYAPLPKVTLIKESRGITEAYDKPQHDAVLARGSALGKKYEADPYLVNVVIADVTEDFVKMQNLYLNGKQGPITASIQTMEATP